MPNYIQMIETSSGPTKIDYKALANLPVSDVSLSKQGEFADALVVGQKFTLATNSVKELQQKDTELNNSLIEKENALNVKIEKNNLGIDSMKQSISTIEKNVLSSTTEIDKLKEFNSSTNTKINSIQSKITSLESTIETLNDMIDALNNKIATFEQQSPTE